MRSEREINAKKKLGADNKYSRLDELLKSYGLGISDMNIIKCGESVLDIINVKGLMAYKSIKDELKNFH